MNLNLDKSAWRRVTLGNVAKHVTDRVDAETSGLERFLAGEHIPSNDLAIAQWGTIGRDPIGPMFYKRFKPGHVLYVSRRSYLRKTAVPEFEGITGEKTFVLESRDESVLLQRFLPFVLSAEVFHSYAVANSRGSVNPYINWTELANYEFALPPLDVQQRLADLLWTVEKERRAAHTLSMTLASTASAIFENYASRRSSEELSNWVVRIDAGRSPKASPEPAGSDEFGVLKVSAVGAGVFVSEENKRLLSDEEFRPGDSVWAGDLLITRANAVVANVARPCLVEADYPNLMLSDKTLRIVPREGVSTRVLLAALQARSYRAHVRESVGGTEAKNISQKRILKGPVPRLERDEIDELEQHLQANDRTRHAARKRTEAACALKGSLVTGIFGGDE
ncbi:restriction endonuclease subunit S [Streptomyces rochei]|uniref:restriction endonuclease subunit S n=1 Tax=Streptomyces rochei TaxID=1928 RepID=UPI0033E7FEE4